MHTVGLVLGNDPEKQLEKYLIDLEVEPYLKFLDECEIEDMAYDYKIDPKNLEKLCEKVEEWFGSEGILKDGRLGYMSKENPDWRYDYYAIGGRWAGFLPLKKTKNDSNVADQAKLSEIDIVELLKVIPGFILKEGKWYHSWGDHHELADALSGETTQKWEEQYKKLIIETPDKTLVTVVDIHS